MTPPAALHTLVERFDRNRDAYLSGRYNETQLRREFVDPLFELLGWDVNNTRGYAEAYKDVFHEDAVKIGGATKAPDYSFRVGGTRKFFVETKRPSEVSCRVRVPDETGVSLVATAKYRSDQGLVLLAFIMRDFVWSLAQTCHQPSDGNAL